MRVRTAAANAVLATAMSRRKVTVAPVSSVGRKIGQWTCLSQLGSGSFGIVHVWKNEQSGEVIALKKCRFGPEVALSDKVRPMEVNDDYLLVV